MTFALSRSVLATLAAAVPVALVLPAPVQAASKPTSATHDTTTAKEAHRVDRVPTPKLAWYKCYDFAFCASVKLPLDYDHPSGASTSVALVKVPARKPASKIGSLFLNPGGPGGSGVQLALSAPDSASAGIRDRFDLVGFDPRGTNYSDNVRCFPNSGAQSAELAGLNIAFPYTAAEEKAAVASAEAFGKACGGAGRPLSAAMSTAEVARDMDVLRRAVGDRQLTYLGFSYGTYLGQVYANMFPDRVRAIAIDGVVDPVAWAGTAATASRPQTDRLRSADGAWKALKELFARCRAAGRDACPLLARGNPASEFDTAAKRLRFKPISMQDFGTYSYPDFVMEVLTDLYYPETTAYVTQLVADVLDLTAPVPPGAGAKAARRAAVRQFAKAAAGRRLLGHGPPGRRPAGHPGFEFPYDNSYDAYSAVLCSDGLNPPHAADWAAWADRADQRAPYFGRAWLWSPQCAASSWTAQDEDAYHGPFTRRTGKPLLVVGSYWDPATNYEGARTAARLAPNSRLLSSDNWGHTGFGTSACVNAAVEGYLLDGTLPAAGTVCHGDVQPYAPTMSTEAAPTSPARPLVAPLIPAPLG